QRRPVRSSGRVVPRVALLIGALALLLPRQALAHQDPAGCSAVGVDFAIDAFRADRTTPIGLAEVVSPCETICVRATVAKPDLPTVCAFQGGTVTITTVAGSTVVAMPADIPCLGGTTAPCNPSIDTAETNFAG